MILGTIGFKVYENFSVIDETGTLASGISVAEFSADLFNPSGVEVSNSVGTDIVDLGNGHYRAEFTPDQVGMWYMVVYHDQYFPWGKSDDIQVYTSDISRIAGELSRALGLTQENFHLCDTSYVDYQGASLLTSGKIRIYSVSGSVGSDNDIIGTYQISASYSEGKLVSYKVVKV